MLLAQREILSLVRLPVPPLQPQNDFSNGFDAGASKKCLLIILVDAGKSSVNEVTAVRLRRRESSGRRGASHLSDTSVKFLAGKPTGTRSANHRPQNIFSWTVRYFLGFFLNSVRNSRSVCVLVLRVL